MTQLRTRRSARQRTLWERFVRRFAAAALALLLILAPMYLYANRLFTGSELARRQNTLEDGLAKLNSLQNGLISIVGNTQSASPFLPLRYQDHSGVSLVDLGNCSALLGGYITQQESVPYAGIVFNDGYVITNRWLFYPDSLNTFYPVFLRCGEMTYSQWTAAVLRSAGAYLPEMTYHLSYVSTLNALTYCAKWSTQGLFFALVDTAGLPAMFLEEDARAAGFLRVARSDGTVLLDWKGNALESEFYELSGDVPGKGLHVTVGIPSALIRENILSFRKVMFLYLAAALAVFLPLMFFSIYRSTSDPIARLSGLVFPNGDSRPKLRALQRSFERLEQGIVEMDHTIEDQKAAMARNYLERALTRGFLTQEEQRQFDALHPAFPARFCVALCRILSCNGVDPGAMHPDSLATALTQWQGLLREAFPAVLLHAQGLDSGTLAVILPLPKEGDPREAACVLQRMIGWMRGKMDTGVSVALSDAYAGSSSLHDAWQEVLHIESCAQQDPGAVRTLQTLPGQRVKMPISVADLQTIYNALNACNEELALRVLEECTGRLKAGGGSPALYRHVWNMLRQMLVQLRLEYPAILGDVALPEYSDSGRQALFQTALPACFAGVSRALRDSRVSDSRSSPALLLQFVEENLFSPDLCVDLVASHFGISRPTLQKLFKDAAGDTFAAWVENRRLTRAHKLLTESEASVAEIAEVCGFNSANSFYKAFKRKYGIAPRNAKP